MLKKNNEINSILLKDENSDSSDSKSDITFDDVKDKYFSKI